MSSSPNVENTKLIASYSFTDGSFSIPSNAYAHVTMSQSSGTGGITVNGVSSPTGDFLGQQLCIQGSWTMFIKGPDTVSVGGVATTAKVYGFENTP